MKPGTLIELRATLSYNTHVLNNNLKKARQLIKNRPYLMWSTQNYGGLSPESILESVISYGDWPDFLKLKKILGIKNTAKIFEKIVNKRRNNLRPQTVHLFTKYFEKYA